MDPSYRSQDNPIKKYRQNSVSLHPSKTPIDKSRRHSQVLDSKNPNKIHPHISPERQSIKPSSGLSNRHTNSAASGKENNSCSANKRKKKSRKANYSCVEDLSRPQSGNPSYRNGPDIAARISSFILNEQSKLSSKRDSVNRAQSASKNHRRVNSTYVTTQPRSGSHERKSSVVSNKNSGGNYNMLNNSSILEENLNYSKEYSYIKDNQNDISHISNIYASHANNSNVKVYESFDNNLIEHHGNMHFPIREQQKEGKNFFLDKVTQEN